MPRKIAEFVPAEAASPTLSVRDHLRQLGIVDEDALRYHMNFIMETEKASGQKLNLSRYRPNPDDFLAVPHQG